MTNDEEQALRGFILRHFGVKIHAVEYYFEALNHASIEDGSNNKRLAFLGDGVIKLTIREHYYDANETEDTGILTEKSKKERNVILAKVAKRIGVVAFMKFGKTYEKRPEAKEVPRNLATALEAIIGAIYKDLGFLAAKGAVDRIMKDEF